MDDNNNFFSGLTDDTNSVRINHAERGDRFAARDLLLDIIQRLETGTPLAEDVAKWLSERLTEVANSKKGAVLSAFQLNRKRGGQEKYSEDMQELVAREVISRKEDAGKGSQLRGETYPISQVSEELKISETKVLEFYQKYKAIQKELESIHRELIHD